MRHGGGFGLISEAFGEKKEAFLLSFMYHDKKWKSAYSHSSLSHRWEILQATPFMRGERSLSPSL